MKFRLAVIAVLVSTAAFAEEPPVPCTRDPTQNIEAGITKCQLWLSQQRIGALSGTIDNLTAQLKMVGDELTKANKDRLDLDVYLKACGDRPGCTQPVMPETASK